MRRKPRNPAQRLRTAVEAMPRRTRIAMLEGIRRNKIAVGTYTDPKTGGVCPMLAAHRNGGRTSLASFARSWDRFTGARRPRLATDREVRTLASYIEMSLLRDETGDASLASVAQRIRSERAASRAADPGTAERARPRDTGERHRGRQLRRRSLWAWLRPTKRYDVFAKRLAAAEEQLNEQRAAERPRERQPV